MRAFSLWGLSVMVTLDIVLELESISSAVTAERSHQLQVEAREEKGVPVRRQGSWKKSRELSAVKAAGALYDRRILGGGDDTSSSECSSGVSGIQSSGGSYCCPEECGQCGGVNCSQLAPGAESCCTSKIESSGVMCEDSGVAPCIISKHDASKCSNGITGIDSGGGEICCVAGCGQCGGSGCGNIDGYTADECCEGSIESSGVLCEDTGEAPCIIDSSLLWGASPNPSPSPIMTIPSSCTAGLPSIRFVESSGFKGRIYLEGEGCATMTDIYEALAAQEDYWGSDGAVSVLTSGGSIKNNPSKYTNNWLLACELYVMEGAVFYCRGSNIGGDCDELRIQSTSSKDFHEIRGHGGSLYFESTEVTSWDTSSKKPQESYSKGRSFVRCLSQKAGDETCSGSSDEDYGECRMDIIDSKMGYLGYDSSEAYGLSWKVRGYCDDGSNPEVFERTNVYGNIMGSEIYGMYYGMYSYGHQGGVWTHNRMYDNHQYGFDPHDDSDYLTIANNKVYNNVNHGIIASKRCNNVVIYGNEVYDGGKNAAGIYLHRSSDNALVYNNYVHDIQDGGITIMESFDAEVYGNTVKDVEYGIRITTGGSRNNIHDNYFDNCETAGLYTYKGSETPDASDDGRPADNNFVDNEVRNTESGVYLRNMDRTLIQGNTFSGIESFKFNDVTDTTWKSNTVPSGVCMKSEDSTFTGDTPADSCY